MGKKEYLYDLKKRISEMSEKELNQRDIYLKLLAEGVIQGPPTGLASIDKPWLKYYEESAIIEEMPRMTAYNYMYVCNKNNLDDYAINFHGKITYREFFEKIDQATKAFVNLGISEGDYVTLCVPTIPETIYAFYALNRLGAICNFIDLRMNKERILKSISDTNSKLVISFNGVSEKVASVLDESCSMLMIDIDGTDLLNPIVKKIYKLKGKDRIKCNKKNIISWSTFIKNGLKIDDNLLKKIDDKLNSDSNISNKEAAIVYTGGTTGEPKGAILTNDSINLPCFQYSKADIPRDKNDKFIDIMPPFIAYGLIDGIQLPFVLGMECILFPKFNPFEFSQILKKYKPSHFVGIPLHYEILMSDKRCKNLDLSFVKNAGCGGDTIPESLEKDVNKFLREHNCPYMMRCGFGMTENAAMSIYDINNAMTKEGRLGIPMQKMKIAAVDESFNELQFNQVGELMINSPAIINGYLNNPLETEKTIKIIHGEKWIKTGDIVSIDTDGNVQMIGRKKTMIIRPDGHNVWPEIIRNILFSCPIIKDVCVVGIKSKYNEIGEIPTAIVVLKEQSMNQEEATKIIFEYQSHLLGERDGVIDIRFRDSLPLTSIGKLDSIRIAREENETLSDIDFSSLTAQKKKVFKK